MTENRSVLKTTLMTLLILLGIGAALFYAAHAFGRFEVEQHEQRRSRPRVMHTRPVDGEPAAPADAPLRVDLFLPATGKGVDPATLSDDSVRLLRATDGEIVPAHRTAAADGGSISLTPSSPLDAGERYRLEITDRLLDETGEPFIPYTAEFRVAAAQVAASGDANDRRHEIAYEQAPVTESIGPSMFTSLAIGPSPEGDGARDLFAGTADGRIVRFAIRGDGTLEERSTLMGVVGHNDGPRLVTGLAFDPADAGTLWVSHGVAALSGAPDFTGKLSTLSGTDYTRYADRVIGLPRAYRDHLNFGIAFAPDGALYLSQGSNTSTGAPDTKWNNRPERLLTAAILRIDPRRLPAGEPLDVTTAEGGGSYDPFIDGAPLRIHASGVRSGYTLLWHSSGRLFTAINGAGRGGNTPAVTGPRGALSDGPIMSVDVTTDDTLADVTRPGTYHGHPNAIRGEYVLMGGNPTPGEDPLEIPGYGVGTLPEPHFAMPAFNFGKGYSPNGLAESRADVFAGALKGCIFVTRFSAGDDIVILRLDERGNVTDSITGAPGLTHLGSPLAIVEDPATGNLYVSEADTQRLVILRPRAANE